jgi:glutathione S-transferase
MHNSGASRRGIADSYLPSLREAPRRSNPFLFCGSVDCFAPLAMTVLQTSDKPSPINIHPEESPMLTLHHLNDSRSQRILWLLEELGTPYEMKRYQRDATTRLAPPELTAVHPLGKSPVITDGDVRIAESGAIVDYIIRRYGQGNGKPTMMPAPGSADYEAYNEWLHYSEGSAMLPLMLNLYVSRLKEAGAPLHPRIDSEIANHLGYVDGALKGREFFVGKSLTGADIQMSFVGEMAKVFDKLGPYPNLSAWLSRMHARPAFQRSVEKGGAYRFAK